MAILISNEQARKVFQERQGLCQSPTSALHKKDLLALVDKLGFVQIDSISTVERAHHMILFSRNQTYRRDDLQQLLEKDGELFEHWTHDASVIPAAFFRYWKHRFRRREEVIGERWRKWHGEDFDKAFEETYQRIVEGGAIMSRDMKADDHKSGGWWNWHPNKTALEYYWHTGKLAIAGRTNFQKIYDLTERVLPQHHHEPEVSHEAFVDWACRSALARLGFATTGEIAAFWDLLKPQEAKEWADAHRDELADVVIESANGSRPRNAFALQAFLPQLDCGPQPPSRVRVLSPFDPLLRDRNRAERLFNFSYRIEIFVPEPKRQYGYYVFPLIEGDRMIGRIDMKADRKAGVLDIRRLWLEPGVKPSNGRLDKLEAELWRVARFAGVEKLRHQAGWRGEKV